MAFVSKLNAEQWAEAARMRAAGASYEEIGQRFGILGSSVGKHAREHGWPGTASSRPVVPRKGTFMAATAAVRRKLVRRVYRAIDTRLTLLERSMTQQIDKLDADPSAPVGPAADAEREARAIGALVRNLDKITEFAAELDRAAAGGPGATDAAALASEADAFRRELAQRLAKLVPSR
jgi:hypothetical protein